MSESDLEPTVLCCKGIDDVVKKILNGDYDLKPIECSKCSKKYYQSYGNHLNKCDQCYFSMFPKEEVRRFYMSFLE